MWLIILSDQLPIVALVGSYPTNKLIGRGPLSRRHGLTAMPFLCSIAPAQRMRSYPAFPRAIPHRKVGHPRVTHPSATNRQTEVHPSVRLACVTHAASVCPEPGSNSPSSCVYAGVISSLRPKRTTPHDLSLNCCVEPLQTQSILPGSAGASRLAVPSSARRTAAAPQAYC